MIRINEVYSDKKIQQEIAYYAKVENVHDLPDIFHYWSNKYLRPKLESFGFSNTNEFYIQYIKNIYHQQDNIECNILSIGAGNCDTEVEVANLLVKQSITNFSFSCLDINPYMLQRGEILAKESGLISKFNFIETDINSWKINNKYHIIIANQSLHHFVELELLFNKIYDALYQNGFFLTNDMIGRNGHMRWPEALEFVQAFWSLLEDRHKYNHQLKRLETLYENWDCSKEGFEGIRSQEILQLLLKKFKFDFFLGFGNLIDIFVDRSFGHNFNPDNELDLTFIDFVAKLDDYYIESGKIKPTKMIAAMTKEQIGPIKKYKHLLPEFCVRIPDEIDYYTEANHSGEKSSLNRKIVQYFKVDTPICQKNDLMPTSKNKLVD